jgi:TonB-linked SusC/RagA family outer membrane protein
MRKFLLTCFAFAIALYSYAQERTVSGKVTGADDGAPLPGVNILVKGSTTGTVTDADGKYTINVPNSGGTLVFSFIGLQSQEVEVGERTTVDVQMVLDIQQLSEVVVTAIGIEREKKALGYSVATVSSENIAQRSEPDPLRALQGKMPGVNIIGGGGSPGQSTKINIRGISSMTGNTQPLFIVDGVPFDNSVNGSTGSDQNTVFSNRAFDLDPNNIESISILKGAAASALYGSRATNGVVVVTTKAAKKGVKKGLEISYNGSMNFENISGIPDYQDVYTQGSNQVYNGGFIGNWGAPFPNHVDRINAQYGTNYSKSYGTYPDGEPYPEGTAPNPINNRYPGLFPEYVQDYNGTDVSAPYEVRPHDIIGGFFRTGKVVENAFSISSGSEKANLNAGFSRMDQNGIIPNSEAKRTSLSFGGNGQLENGLFLSGNVNYVNTFQQAPQSGGSAFNDYYAGTNGNFAGSGSIFARLFYLPRNFDLMGLPFENPVDNSNVFYRALDNPRWIAKYNLYTSNVNRVYGNLTAGFDVTEWLNFTVKGGINTYTDNRRSIVRKGGILVPNGEIWTEDLTNTEQDYNFIATITKDLTDDFSLRLLAGLNANQRELNRRKVTGSNIISNGLNKTDATSTQIVDYDFDRLRRLYGVYSDISLSYKDYLFLNLVGRNDWSSTLPEANNSYFYPGASVSLVLSEVATMPTAINFAKIRASATKVGNDADPYLTGVVYSITTPFTTGGDAVNRATLGDLLGNSKLKPEFTTEYEGGVELQFLNNRIGLDLTYFSRKSTDQIARAALPRSSGFTQEIVNIGELTNKGWEIGLDLTPVKMSNGFTWNSFVAFTKIKSEIVDAGPTGEILIGGPSGTFGTIHKNGNPYGQIYGTRYARHTDGSFLIDPNTGMPFPLPESQIIGNPNPDFTLGWTNTFSYKGVMLKALIDWKQGGDFYSFTGASLLLRGQLANSINREALRVVPGVYGDPQTYAVPKDENDIDVVEKNTTPVTAFDTHFSNGWGAYGADEVNIYDGTVIRLREVSLGYSLPKSLLTRTPFGSVSLSVSGRNLWFNAPNVLDGLNLDPEVLGEPSDSNVQGFEYGAAPTTRRYGFNLALTF